MGYFSLCVHPHTQRINPLPAIQIQLIHRDPGGNMTTQTSNASWTGSIRATLGRKTNDRFKHYVVAFIMYVDHSAVC